LSCARTSTDAAAWSATATIAAATIHRLLI
jgi:hypothetical protein